MNFIKKHKRTLILSIILSFLISFFLLPSKTISPLLSHNQDCHPSNTTLALANLSIINSIGDSINFEIEIADSVAKKAQGLMFRKELPKNRGMLFPFKTPKIVNMWMFNTQIGLDIIFINQQNKIVKIVENSKPMSSSIINSGQKILNVLEINAGLSKKFKIEVGNQIKLNDQHDL